MNIGNRASKAVLQEGEETVPVSHFITLLALRSTALRLLNTEVSGSVQLLRAPSAILFQENT